MSRDQLTAQRNRTQANPLVLGTFDTTTLRYLKGRLGPQNKLIGYKDTSQTSNGGFGGGSYNHWFQINLSSPGWIITVKGPPRPKYIQVSAYDLDKLPLQSRSVFDSDSLSVTVEGETSYPYLDHVMQSQSDLYNVYVPSRLDKGDTRYEPLPIGSYLICVSTTRNEPLDYELGLIIEFPPTGFIFALEDASSLFLTEDGDRIALDLDSSSAFFTSFLDSVHEHSLSEWQNAWESQHQDTDKFPSAFIPLANRP